LPPDDVQPLRKRGRLRKWSRPSSKLQLPLGEGVVEAVEIFPAKDPREGSDGEKELPPSRRNPAVFCGGQGAPGHETMHVEMLVEVLPPGMEDERGAQVAPQPARVSPEGV